MNKATINMAESLSEDLRNMVRFEELAAAHQTEEPQNDIAAWQITICLSESGAIKNYAKLRTISSDIIRGATEKHLQLTAPIYGYSSACHPMAFGTSLIIGKLALETVRIPDFDPRRAKFLATRDF